MNTIADEQPNWFVRTWRRPGVHGVLMMLWSILVFAALFAGWIAPPVMGVNRQPIDFEYVRFG